MTGLRKTAAKVVAFALTASLAFMLIYNTMQDAVPGELVGYEAEFTNVSGLRVGDNVRVAGVAVGKVTLVKVDGRQAKVGLEVSVDQPILDTTKLVMRYQNLLGQRYLALTQGAERGSRLAAGSTLPVSQTDPGFDLTQLLNGFKPLFEVLKPADVNELARSLVQVLQGEGGTVEDLLNQTTRLTNFLADRDEVYAAVLTNLTPMLEDLDDHGDEVASTVKELKLLMTGLAKDSRVIGGSLQEMSELVRATSSFLVAAQAPSIRLVRSLRATAGMFAVNVEALRAAVEGFPLLIGALGRISSYENAANVYPCTVSASVLGQTVKVPVTEGPYSKVCGG